MMKKLLLLLSLVSTLSLQASLPFKNEQPKLYKINNEFHRRMSVGCALCCSAAAVCCSLCGTQAGCRVIENTFSQLGVPISIKSQEDFLAQHCGQEWLADGGAGQALLGMSGVCMLLSFVGGACVCLIDRHTYKNK